MEYDPATPAATVPTKPAVTGAIVDAPLGGFPTAAATFGLLTTGDPLLADQPNDAPNDGKSVEAQTTVRSAATPTTTSPS